MPEEGENIVELPPWKYTQFCPFVAAPDFETMTVEIDEADIDNKSTIKKTHVHKVYSVCLKMSCIYNIVCGKKSDNNMKLFRGTEEQCMKKLFSWLKELSIIVKTTLEIKEPIIWGNGDREKYEAATRCYSCNQEFSELIEENHKVADHCHYSGYFRGAACNNCNIQLKFDEYKLPVYFHNGKGFDFHFLVQNMGKYVKENINVLPNSMEKFLSISYGNIKFVDSMMMF